MGSFAARFGVAVVGVLAFISTAPAQGQQVHWEGLYVGTHAGYGLSGAKASYADSADTRSLIAGGALPQGYDVGGIFVGGAQLGYNFRLGSLIMGAEGDVSLGSVGKSSSVMINPGFVRIPSLDVVYVNGVPWDSRSSMRLNGISSLRGRVGLTNERLMVFATAGIAFANAKTSGDIIQSDVFTGDVLRKWTGGNSENVSGYVIGAGAEYAFEKKWRIRWEVLRYDFGTMKDTLEPLPTNVSDGNFTSVHRSTNLDVTVVRGGLSYKF